MKLHVANRTKMIRYSNVGIKSLDDFDIWTTTWRYNYDE